MSSDPLVSVVIPAYNAEPFIDEAVRSVFRQSYSNIELIVVNDGSTDATVDRLATYRHQVEYIAQENSGGYPGSPRNSGMRQSRGSFICFLDADDIMAMDKVERQVDFLSRHADVGVVFTDYQNFSINGKFDKTHFETCPRLTERLGCEAELVLRGREAIHLLLNENFGLPSSAMIRKEVLGPVPSFSTDFQIGEDFHFFYRIARQYAVGIINRVGTHRRVHGSNITGNAIRVLENCSMSRADLRKSELDAECLNLLTEYLFQCEIDLARAYSYYRKLGKAYEHNFRAFSLYPLGNLGHMKSALLGLMRTTAIALRVKAPCL